MAKRKPNVTKNKLKKLKELKDNFLKIKKRLNDNNLIFFSSYFYMESLIRFSLKMFGYKETTKFDTNQIKSLKNNINLRMSDVLFIKVIYASSQNNIKEKFLHRVRRDKFVHNFQIIGEKEIINFLNEINKFLEIFEDGLISHLKKIGFNLRL